MGVMDLGDQGGIYQPLQLENVLNVIDIREGNAAFVMVILPVTSAQINCM
jgi:hypothetical protein